MNKILTALITPFDESGHIDLIALTRIVKMQMAQGVDGFVVCGTTAEAPTLSMMERKSILKTVLDITKDQVEVWYGCGSNHTQATLKAIQMVEDIKLTGIMLVVPYYNRPSQKGICKHFETLANATKHNIMLYNVPSRCGVALSYESMHYLITHCPNIVALKHASSDFSLPYKLLQAFPDFIIYSGEDAKLSEITKYNMAGIISVMSHIVLAEMKRAIMHEDPLALEVCKECASLCFCDASPSPIKYMLSVLDFCKPYVRLPIVEIDREKQERIDDWLIKNDKFHNEYPIG